MRFVAAIAAALLLGACTQDEAPVEEPETASVTESAATAEPELDPATGLKMAGDWQIVRANCVACHSGPAAREEIRTTHPERVRCNQCHVPVETVELFLPAGISP